VVVLFIICWIVALAILADYIDEDHFYAALVPAVLVSGAAVGVFLSLIVGVGYFFEMGRAMWR